MRVRSTMFAVALLSVVALTGAGGSEHVPDGGASVTPPDVPATAFLYDHDGAWIGTADFVPVPGGLFVSVYVEGQPPGVHGIHVHMNADCRDTTDPATGLAVPFGGAGAHFDPDATMHHGGPDDPADVSHGGDLGNLRVDERGVGVLEATDHDLTIVGPHSVIGRSLIVHVNQDDFITQPTGGSGGRIACGVVIDVSGGVHTTGATT